MNYNVYIPNSAQAVTTNAQATVLASIALAPDSVCLINATVLGKRTAGSAGAAGDSAGYVRKGAFKRVGAANAAIVGAVTADHTGENQTGWDATLAASGSNVEVRVTGALNNTVSWSGFIAVYTL